MKLILTHMMLFRMSRELSTQYGSKNLIDLDKRSAEFYLRIFGGKVIRNGEPTIVKIANSWIVLNVGGGPTDDKPTITLRTPQNPKEASNFMIIRVADIWTRYKEWHNRGAEFITEPKDHGIEIRCYMRDPDGYIIEVGQTTGGLKDIKMD
jgi:lactoylglutathione lyase